MTDFTGSIAARAPGKIVLWGEYAVLAGAPALVMAVNRYAGCRLQPGDTPGWQVSAGGFLADATRLTPARLLGPEPPPPDQVWRVLWCVLKALPDPPTGPLPERVRAYFDTAAFHYQGAKLGLGSSAALTVALYGAVCRMLGAPASLETALDAHRHLQGGSGGGLRAGSGIDVAAAWHGGCLRFRRDGGAVDLEPWSLPPAVATGFVWTGASTSTSDHLAKLQRWLDAGHHRELDELTVRAAALFEAPDLMTALPGYVQTLEALDHAAGLGIFSDRHRHLGLLAIDAGVVYKPCGAGGGDVGAVFARSVDAIERFNRLAAAAGFLPLALETAPHGIEVTG